MFEFLTKIIKSITKYYTDHNTYNNIKKFNTYNKINSFGQMDLPEKIF